MHRILAGAVGARCASRKGKIHKYALVHGCIIYERVVGGWGYVLWQTMGLDRNRFRIVEFMVLQRLGVRIRIRLGGGR